MIKERPVKWKIVKVVNVKLRQNLENWAVPDQARWMDRNEKWSSVFNVEESIAGGSKVLKQLVRFKTT